MKGEIKPVYIIVAAVAAVALLGILYMAFLREKPAPGGVTREEELKHKGIQQQNYSAGYKQQYGNGGAPGGGRPGGYGAPSGYGAPGGGAPSGYGAPGGGAPSGYGAPGGSGAPYGRR